MILSFNNSEEHAFQEIMQIISKQSDFQIRDMVMKDEILDFGELKRNPMKRTVVKNGK